MKSRYTSAQKPLQPLLYLTGRQQLCDFQMHNLFALETVCGRILYQVLGFPPQQDQDSR